MDRCCRVYFFFKIRCCELPLGFHRPNFVVYSILNLFPSYKPMMMNYFLNCNLNIIHDVFCNGHIFSTFLTSWYFFFGIPNVFVTAQAKTLAFCLWFCFACLCFINCFVKKNLLIKLNVQLFFFCQCSGVSGLPAILSPCFRHMFYVCCVICLAMNRYNLVSIFYCNFHFQKYQSHSGCLRQKSNRFVIYRNVIPILSLQCLFLYIFIPVGRSAV